MGTGRAATCPACKGAWVPFASIEVVMPRLAELAPRSAEGLAAAGDPAAKLKCPECGGDLVTVKSGEARGGAVRTCLVCFGRWIDGAELARFRRRGLLGRLLDIFRSKPSPAAGPSPEAAAPPPAPEESARTEPPEEAENRD
jgi:Zn-finger nucleic acid-binding protein